MSAKIGSSLAYAVAKLAAALRAKLRTVASGAAAMAPRQRNSEGRSRARALHAAVPALLRPCRRQRAERLRRDVAAVARLLHDSAAVRSQVSALGAAARTGTFENERRRARMVPGFAVGSALGPGGRHR